MTVRRRHSVKILDTHRIVKPVYTSGVTTPSHRLKLHRAEKHLIDLDDMTIEIGQRKQYPVSETINAKRKRTYRLDLSGVEVDEMFPIVFGDFLFNVRSALDHLMVAIAPNKRKANAGFSINTKDPLAVDENSGCYLDAEKATKWLAETKGLPDDCVTALRLMQPYETAAQGRGPAQDHPLAILSALHNADKHRNLIPVLTALGESEVTVNNVTSQVVPGGVLKDGAMLHASNRPMKVEIEGSAVIGIGPPHEPRDFAVFIDALTLYIGSVVLPDLEKFL